MLSTECSYCGKKCPNNLATKNHMKLCKFIPPKDEHQIVVIKTQEIAPDFVKIMNPYSQTFPLLHEDDRSHDVTLVSRDGSLATCHAAVLAASSPFLADLLEDSCRRDNSVLIVAQNVDGGQMKNLLEFLYMGKIKTSKERANSMKVLLEEFQIKVTTEDILENSDMFKADYVIEQRGYNADENDEDYKPTKKLKKIKQEDVLEDITEDLLEKGATFEEDDTSKHTKENDKDYVYTNKKFKKNEHSKSKTSNKRGQPKKAGILKKKKLKSACEYCELKSKSLKDTMKHVQKDHPDFFDSFAKIHIQTPCKYCDQKFLDKVLLYFHKREFHPESLPTGQRMRYNINDGLPHLAKRQCPHCPVILPSLRQYKDHIQKHLTGKDQPFQCETCEKKFCKSDNLRTHRKKHILSTTPFLCNLCGSTFQTEFDYEKHNRAHTLEIPKKRKHFNPRPVDSNFSAVCSVCGKGFTKKKLYAYHIKSSHVAEDKLLKCNQCPQTFTGPPSYENHIKLHFPPTQVCNHCGKKFHTHQYLRRHIRSLHVDDSEKAFVCSQCGKGFGKKDSYEGHLNMHAGLKPFKCRYCQMCYQNSSNRIAHEKSRHSDIYIRRADGS